MKALKSIAFLLLVGVYSAKSSTSSLAQQPAPPNCGPAEQVIAGLRSDHGETPTFGGVDSNGVRVILFLNAGTGSWTLVVSPLPGIVCGVTEGEHGALAKKAEAGKES